MSPVKCAYHSGCCPNGDVCTDSGCCDYGERECEAGTCYDPDTEVCCKDGTNCPLGSYCYTTGCCITGTKPCGSYHCYDPDTETCCDSGRVCDMNLTCCGQECCYSIATCRDDGYCHRKSSSNTATTESTAPSFSPSSESGIPASIPSHDSLILPRLGEGRLSVVILCTQHIPYFSKGETCRDRIRAGGGRWEIARYLI